MLQALLMFAISALLALGSLGAVAWDMLNPETLDVDKIFSIIACFLLGIIFLGISAGMLFHTRLRELWKPAPSVASDPREASGKQKESVPEEVGKPVH